MNKTIATILAATALSTTASSVLASDYSEEVRDIKKNQRFCSRKTA